MGRMFDVVIVGAGIVGLSTAWQLQRRFPHKKILLLDKESAPAQHQTGHNSGVIHAGVYYPSGSLKAQFCKEGAQATLAFCREHNIPFEQCGKLLVATNALELERMQPLYERCLQNGLSVEKLSAAQLKMREPHVQGVGAIRVPDTGIVDYRLICQKMAEEFVRAGGAIRFSSQVVGLQETAEKVVVKTRQEEAIDARFLVACAGLQADRLVDMMGLPRDFAIVPFRGEYFRLGGGKNHHVNHLIYPIPDPELPFLGVHLTRMIDGSITVGPNAVLGWKREGYGRFNFSARDTFDNLRFVGLWKLMGRQFASGVSELYSSWNRRGYLKRVQKYYPSARLQDLEPYPAGIRAQAVMKDGSLVHDFLFAESSHSLHVCNAPSPAATSAIPIGEYLVDRLVSRKGWDKNCGEM